MKRIIITTLFTLSLCLGCSSEKSDTGENSLIIYSSHHVDLLNMILDDFKLKNPDINVEVIAAGTGELLKRIEAEKVNPLGDILLGGTLNSVKSKSDLFENYVSTNEANIYE